MFTSSVSKIVVVMIATALLIWFGVSLAGAAKNLEQASLSRMAKIDSIFDKN